jgi:hypothetical protein
MFRNNYTIFFVLLATALSLGSCKKWVDVKPPLQVDQDELFSTEEGFKDVLNGVYLQMGSRSTYGRDLNLGLLSVLGRSYDTTITPAIGNFFLPGSQVQFPGCRSESNIQKYLGHSLLQHWQFEQLIVKC